ncbi:T9SS type A sorting domain-containing protein [Flavobacterium aestuarii]|uniref:T9SS type A sorting domain-containing protein n=1 Tax=Flavobacterium aestuarii TaxID=3149227 RepID=UPI0032B60820
MKMKLLLLLLLLAGANAFAQFTSIPDANFEAKLIEKGYDDVADGKVLTSKINTLTSLDVSAHFFTPAASLITDLTGIQDFIGLTELKCESNKISTLDVSKNTKLINLSCYGNRLTSLDLSKNTALTSFNCSNNKLLSLNIKNGNNASFNNFSFNDNIHLTCIVVDDADYANANWTAKKDAAAFYTAEQCSSVTILPAASFEDKLIALGIDADGKNGYVLNSSIASLTTLDVSNSSLTDLTGLEGFTSLKTLNCSNNLLQRINLSKNTDLAILDCSNNANLTCIQVANIAEATNNWTTTKDEIAAFNLDCTAYTLIPDQNFEKRLIEAELDNLVDGKVITANINKIKYLQVIGKSVKDLTGIQDFVSLTSLNCRSNQLTSIDLSKNTNLSTLICDSNQLTTLDISKNTALTQLDCSLNQLKELNVSTNTALKELNCYSNKLVTLDVNQNTALTTFYCSKNQLTNLSLKNGKNTFLKKLTFTENPNLYCISVDDAAYANANWNTQKDVNALYSSYDCSTITQIPDTQFEDKLIALGIDTDGKNGLVLNSSIAAVTSLDVSNSAIANLTGIQGFTALTTLNAANNSLKSIDLSKNSSLTTLDCSNNAALTCIQVADIAHATNNWATTKDAAANFNLDCNEYTLIPDTSFEAKLIALQFDEAADGKVLTSKINTLKSLDVSRSSITDLTGIQDFTSLNTLRCESNKLTSLDVSKNTALKTLACNNNALTSIDVSKNTALTYLNISSNKINTIDISTNISLTSIDLDENNLTSLDVSKNTALTYLDCSSNKFTSLDVSKNTALTNFWCRSNQLTKLNLKNGANTLLTSLNFSFNRDLSCVIVDDIAYANTNWSNQQEVHPVFSPHDCSISTLIPNGAFEDKLIALGIDTDGKNGAVLNASIETITTLDISNSSLTDLTGLEGFTALTTLNASNNLLNSINLSKTTAFTTLDCSNNPELSCIQVADVAHAEANWTVKKDALANFTLDCNRYTLIPDANFEAELIEEKLDDIADGKVLTSKINKLKSLTFYSYDDVSDFTGIEDFVSLTNLDCNGLEITKLDLSKNTALTNLRLEACKLTSLDVSKNTALISLNCYQNQLAALDVSQNTALEWFECSSNILTSLDITKNTALLGFKCRLNQLKTLDVSKNTKLNRLECQNNKIESLDISKNVALTSLNTNSNRLSALNLKNGKNSQLTALDFSDNPALSCIVVDDIDYANTNWSDKKEAYSYFTIYDCSTITRIPDGLFEDKLIALGIDTDGKNGHVLNSSIETLTALDVSNSSITDAKGLEGFTALQTLNISNNSLTGLDLSKNSVLKTLNCSKNASLTCIMVADVAVAKNNWTTTKDATADFSLDCRPYTLIPDTNFEAKLIALEIDDTADGKVLTSSISNLTILDVGNSSITDLTGIQDFVSLTNFNCNYNQITALDVTKNTKLTGLGCTNNKLTSLDVSKNPLLEILIVSNNELTQLDLSTGLKELYCTDNQITALDVSKNTELEDLDCANNKITALDVSKNTKLRNFDCRDNKLTNLNLKNGNNSKISFPSFYNNPNLSCILVDDAVYANANWKNRKDDTAIYTTFDCSTITGIPDPLFEDKLIALGIDTDGKNELVLNSSIQTVTTLDVSNTSINNLTGIQGFTALTDLKADSNKLITLDVSKNTALTALSCRENQLEKLDITKNISLTELNVSSNKLTALDISKNIALTNLIADTNKLTVLDVSKNISLSKLYLSSNQLTDLDVSKNTALTLLDFSKNQVTSINLTKNKVLTQLFCDSNKLPSLNITENTALTELNCSSNQLTSLNLKNGNNTNFNAAVLHLENNPNLSCIKVDDKTYSDTNWSGLKDATAFYDPDCGLSLPSDNFIIETKGESCLGENNGEINITASETFLYTASINGENYPFTDNALSVIDLAPGNYTISITIPGETFEQSFNLVIAKGTSITGKSTIKSKKVNIEITDGTAPYTVFVDGIEQFQTSDSSFSLTAKGGNLLEVKTAKACEGIYAEDITGLDLTVSAYPNPTSGSFEIVLPVADKEVSIEINAFDGRVISNKKYSLENGTAQLTLENEPSGVYIAKIHSAGSVKNVKIIKN